MDLKHLTVSVDVKGLDPFKRMISVMGEMVIDERIAEQIRLEYVKKIIEGQIEIIDESIDEMKAQSKRAQLEDA